MPLSTGLIAYYFPPQEQAKMMGLSTAMNQMGGFRNAIKYFAPLSLIVGYAFYAGANGMAMILIGSAFIGLGNGVGVPYLLTIASIKGGRNSATTVMPLLSAALYLGQFLSPIIVIPLSEYLFGADDIVGALFLVAGVVSPAG